MQQPIRNSLSVLGIIIAVVSLWFTWLTFQQAPIDSAFLEVQQALMGNSGPITYSGAMAGFTGSLLYIPIWIVVLVISAAHTMQLMNATDFFYVPKVILWITLIVALFFPVFAIVYPLFRTGITPSTGPYIALLSTAIASATLMIPNAPQTQKTIEAKDG